MREISSILILDDEQDFRKLIIKMLQPRYGDETLHEYDPLTQGAPAEDFDWSQYQLLLLDQNLNIDNVTGLDIIHKNKDNPGFPVTIMLTASDDEEIAFKALKLGICDFIRKHQLTKKILYTSIDGAIATRKRKQKQLENLAKIQKIFNKKYFYNALKTNIEDLEGINKRIIIGFRVADKPDSTQPMNALNIDRVIRHIAKESCRFFMSKNYAPYITLFGENKVAILFDVKDPAFDEKILIKRLHQFHLQVPYVNQEHNVSYDLVSCVLSLTEKTVSQSDLIKYFQTACDKAAKINDVNHQIFITSIQQLRKGEQQPIADSDEIEQILSKTNFNIEIKKNEPEHNQLKNDIYEVEFDVSKLDDNSKRIIDGINENMMVKTYQPIVMLTNSEKCFIGQNDFYYLSSQFVDDNDQETTVPELLQNIDNNEVVKYYDRWLLKETISKIIDIKPGVAPCYFVLKLQHESLIDATFFNWLRKLLNDFEKQNPGTFIVLEISQKDIVSNEKQIVALINYLNHSHGFRFALSEIDDIGQLVYLTPKIDISLLILNHQNLSELNLMSTIDENPENYLTYLKRNKKHIVATDIVDSKSLTTALASGADFAMGDFIGPPKASFEEGDAIPSYEIESDEFVSSRL